LGDGISPKPKKNLPESKKNVNPKSKIASAIRKEILAEIERTCTEKMRDFPKNCNRKQKCPFCGSDVPFELHAGEKVPCYNTGRANGLRWVLQTF
jgi:hypothetical protein